MTMQKMIDKVLNIVKQVEGYSLNQLAQQFDDHDLLHSIVVSLAKMNRLIAVDNGQDMYLFSVDDFTVIQGKEISTEDTDTICAVHLWKTMWATSAETHDNLTYAEAKQIFEDVKAIDRVGKKTFHHVRLLAKEYSGGSVNLEFWSE